eukprot:533322-Prymnesium_polylepis.1
MAQAVEVARLAALAEADGADSRRAWNPPLFPPPCPCQPLLPILAALPELWPRHCRQETESVRAELLGANGRLTETEAELKRALSET